MTRTPVLSTAAWLRELAERFLAITDAWRWHSHKSWHQCPEATP